MLPKEVPSYETKKKKSLSAFVNMGIHLLEVQARNMDWTRTLLCTDFGHSLV